MQEVELQEYFGPLCVVQFREAVMVALGGDKKIPFMEFRASGDPHFMAHAGQIRPVAREQIEPSVAEDGSGFTLILKARLLPAAAGRVFVLYESGPHIAKLCMRAEDIFAVTVIEEKGDAGSRIVAPPS